MLALGVGALSGHLGLANPAQDSPIDLSDSNNLVQLGSDERDRYKRAIESIEREQGVFDSSLSEQLLALGLASQRAGQHREAVDVLRRGAHITRINRGLYSDQQIPFIKAEIVSLDALNDQTEADQRQEYLVRLQERALTPGVERAQAWLSHARWQRAAFLRNPSETQFLRLADMLSVLDRAVSDLADTNQDVLLSETLHGLLQTYFLITWFDNSSERSPFEERASFNENQPQNNFYEYFRISDRSAPVIIAELVKIQSRLHGDTSYAAFHASIQLADWYLWRDQSRNASDLYRQIDTVIGELPDPEQASALRAELFQDPVLLPDLGGLRLIAPSVPKEEGNLSIAFNVTDRGSVRSIERVKVDESIELAASRFIRQLRRAKFRPRVVAGETVTTKKMEQTYVLPQS